jgi:hypothetical protein
MFTVVNCLQLCGKPSLFFKYDHETHQDRNTARKNSFFIDRSLLGSLSQAKKASPGHEAGRYKYQKGF